MDKRVIFMFICVFICANARRFETRCKLVRELNRIGVPNDLFLGSWVCLIEKVSNRDTNAYTEKSGGRKYYGLYQIPNKWCRVGKPGGDCNVACESLLDDDIRDDTACAVKIHDRQGFQYWSLFKTRCQPPDVNHIVTEIYKCPELIRFDVSPEREISNDTSEKRRRLG